MALLDPILQWNKSLELVDYPVVAQVVSRGRTITTLQASPKVWQFKLSIETPHLQWQNYQEFLEELRDVNLSTSFTFTLANTPSLQFMVGYNGAMTSAQRALVRTQMPQTGDSPLSLRLSNAPLSLQNVFRAGDYIQVVGDIKPYTVRSTVNSNAAGEVLLTLNRPLFTYPNPGSSLMYGSDVTWSCFFTSLPTPSATSQYYRGISWSGDFEFVENA